MEHREKVLCKWASQNTQEFEQPACPKHRSVAESGLSDEQFGRILCPNLRMGVRMGLINPDAQGWVSIAELKKFLQFIGLKPGSVVERTLISTGVKALSEKKAGFIKIVAFEGSFLDHGSSSGILNNSDGFSEIRLAGLLSFSSDGEIITEKDLAKAANAFHKTPSKFSSFNGTLVLSLELSGLLNLYGRRAEDGSCYFTLYDVRDIWLHNRFPQTWVAPSRASTGTWRTLKKTLSLIFARIAA